MLITFPGNCTVRGTCVDALRRHALAMVVGDLFWWALLDGDA